MDLAAAAMDPLLRKLGELLTSELTLERRVRKDVLSLQSEMMFMHAALQGVGEVPPDRLDKGVAAWARQVRELSYDMDDAVDAFMVRVEEDPEPARAGLTKNRVQEFVKKTARLFSKGKALHQIADAIGDAQSLAERLGQLRQRYGVLQQQQHGHGGAVTGASIDPRLKGMFRAATELVGIDGSRDELMKMLSDGSNKRLHTVSIVGFGGLGKTTLARAVYDSVKPQFECGAFVSVSRRPDIARIYKRILCELDEEKYGDIDESAWDAGQLISELIGILQNKRFLIVIDDIWDARNWEFIKGALPKNCLGSALITTTRISSVSEACCSAPDDKIYKMKPLSDSDSQRLFYMRIFGQSNGCPPELEQVSRDILKKCGGVPLAIISIASLLASHNKQIKAKDEWYIVLNSVGRGITEGGNMEDMRTILSYSYYNLPSYLKTCILYLSIFPEDHEIEKDRLIWRWIAEGFVQRRTSGDNLYELGESYFNELINTSMVKPVGFDFEGRAQSCHVHDMVLDLLCSLSREENFVTVWDGTAERHDLPQIKPRRLSLQNVCAQGSITSMLQVRSFTAFSPAIDSMPSLSQLQVLRVLDLEGCALKKCGSRFELRHVGNLSHLRYLGLRRTYISQLPVEIGKLHFLQTLDVRGARGIQALPPTITRLRRLMCLRLDWDTRLPIGLSNLTSLEELTGLGVGLASADTVRELGHLTALRVLTMRWEEQDCWGDALLQSLGNLSKMQSLEVFVHKGGRSDLMRSWAPPPALRRFASRGPSSALPTLPAWVSASSLPRLTYMDILVDQVRRGDLETLGTLPALLCLRLRAAGRIEGRPAERLEVRPGAFPCARACTFLHFVTATSMFPRGAMPMAQRLEFSVRAWDVAGGGGGVGLEDLSMGHLHSLEEVTVELWYRKNAGDEVDRVAAALRDAVAGHPNHPTLRINRRISRSNGP